MKSKSRHKTRYRGIRFPPRLDEIVVDIQGLLGGEASYTDALLWILVDWEKFRYLSEKKRLLKLAELRYHLVRQEAKKPKQ